MIVSQLPNITGISSDDSDTLERALDVARGVDDVVLAPLLLGIGGGRRAGSAATRPAGPRSAPRGARCDRGDGRVRPRAARGQTVGDRAAADSPRSPSRRSRPTPGPRCSSPRPESPSSRSVGTSSPAGPSPVGPTSASTPIRSSSRSPAANAATGLAGGFPVSSSDSRTALAVAAGASSQLASLAAAASVAVVLVAAAPLLEVVPARRACRTRGVRRRQAGRHPRDTPRPGLPAQRSAAHDGGVRAAWSCSTS